MIGRIRLRVIVPAIVLWLLWVAPLNLLAQIGIQYGAAVPGVLTSAAPVAMYRFEGEAGDAVTILARTNARCQPRLVLMNPALSQLAVSSPMPSETEAQISFQLLDTAPYYISLNSANGTPCDFVLTLAGERAANRPTNTPPPGPTLPSYTLVPFDINVSSHQVTTFSQSLPTLTYHQLRLNFVHLANAHPQTFRITLTCPGNDQIMLEDLRCGDTFTFTPSALEAGMIPVHTINLAIPPALTSAIAYNLTIAPESPLLPIAADDLVPFNISVSSSQTTVFSQNLPALVIHQLRLNFVDLANAQPQTFRITLTCPGNDQIMLEDLRCGDTFTLAPTAAQAGMIPVHTINLAIPSALTSTLPYTLTIAPESPLLPVAAADSDFLINVPLNTPTTFNQALSAPLGDAVDKITLRVPDLFSGSWDFTLSLLCAGTGAEAVQWSLQTGQVLACGDVFTLTLAPMPSSNPIPSLDMFVALAGQPGPAHVNYTLLITPAGSGLAAGTGTYSFPVALAGESQFLQSLSATMDYHTVNISVPQLTSGSPRQIGFTLTCAGGDAQVIKAGMAGVAGDLVCGSSFQRTFSTASEQAQFVIQLNSTSPVSYMLRAAPVYALVAPPDASPHSLPLHAAQPTTLTEVLSRPEGDYEDRVVLDASQIRSSALPRTYAISLNCQGPGTISLLGEADNGTVFSCGSTFQHTFGAATSTGRPSNQTNPQALPTLPGTRTSSQTGNTATALALRLFLPDGAAPGVTNYILQAVPIEQSATQTTITSSDFSIQASSTTITDFTQTLTPAQSHRLLVRFPDLTNAHAQTFRLQLLCTGVGTTLVRALTDWGDTLLCGGSFDRLIQSFSNNPLPGIDFTLDFVQTDIPGSVNYTLRLEPVSAYVPIAPDDSSAEPYPLVLSTTAQTIFTQEISAPLGDQSDRIQASIPGLSGERTFTFWLKCEGANAGAARLEVELPITNTGQPFHYGVCDVPLPVSINQSAGSSPSLGIRVNMANTSQPAYASYTLYITPAGIEPPFTLPQTATPTPASAPAPTVISTTPPPNLIGPSNNAVFDTQPVQLSWSEIPGARYEVEIRRCTIQGTNCVTDAVSVNATSYSLSTTSSTQVVWRVRALLPDGSFTNFSPSRTFTVFTNQPTATPIPTLALIAPANGAIFDTQPVLLSWSEMPGARYEIEIQRCNLQGANCVTETLLVNATSFTLPVTASSQINWRVRALLPDGSFTDYTSSRSFKVFLGEPTATPAVTQTLTLIAPTDGVSFASQPVPLSWSILPGASRYEIEIQRCATDGTNCATESIITDSTGFALPVPASSHINWRVRATLNDGSTTGFTPYRSFKVFLTGPTITPAATLALIAPADGVSFSAQPVPLSWSAFPGASRYEIEIQRCATDGTNCATESIITDSTGFALPVPASSHINWRVRATLNDGSTTGFTPYRSFKVFLTGPTITPAAALTLIAPADGVSFSAQPVPLSWSAFPGASRYEIEIQRCATDGTNCATESIITDSTSFALPVPASSHINWRVRATLNDGSTTGFTPARSFKVFLTGPTVTPIPAARATPTQALRR